MSDNLNESTIQYLNRVTSQQAQQAPAQQAPAQQAPAQQAPAQQAPAQQAPAQPAPAQQAPAQQAPAQQAPAQQAPAQPAPAQQAPVQQAPAQQQVPQRNTTPNNVRFVSQETEKGRARVARIVTLAVVAGVLTLAVVAGVKGCNYIKSSDDKDNDKKRTTNESDDNTLTYDEGKRYEDENGNPINVETQTIEEDFTSVIKETTSEGFVVTYTGKDGLKYSLVFDSEDTYNAWDASNGQIELKYEDGQLKLKNKTK